MKLKHIILRSPRGTAREVFRGASPLARPAELEAVAFATPAMAVDELTPRDLALLARDSEVVAIAPAMPMRLIKPVDIGAAPAAAASWGISAVSADTSPFTGDGVVAAVLDTGIDATHPAFAGVNLVRRNFTTEADGDLHGHGTHCAGTIFGRDTSGTRIGVARGIKKALIGKVLGNGGGSSESIASAIQWAAENGAHVISMSLGIDFPGYVKDLENSGLPTEPATSQALEGYRANVQLFERLAGMMRASAAFGQPVMIVAAAGNESDRPTYEISVSPPAVAEGILSVAAIGKAGAVFSVAPFSNTGANVAAPGVSIVSAKLGGGLASMSGTSMATPHTAGVAALWAEKLLKTKPLNGLEWTARLIASATTTGFQAGFDPLDIGAGLVRAPQS